MNLGIYRVCLYSSMDITSLPESFETTDPYFPFKWISKSNYSGVWIMKAVHGCCWVGTDIFHFPLFTTFSFQSSLFFQCPEQRRYTTVYSLIPLRTLDLLGHDKLHINVFITDTYMRLIRCSTFAETTPIPSDHHGWLWWFELNWMIDFFPPFIVFAFIKVILEK